MSFSSFSSNNTSIQELDSLKVAVMYFLQADNEDSLKLSLQELKKIVEGLEFSELKELKKIKAAKNKKITSTDELFSFYLQAYDPKLLEIERTKSKLLSLILLLISSASFVYLVYYTDKKSREKSSSKIIAAKKITETEIDLKNKISEKLHDDIGGSLAALKMRLSLLNDPNYYKSLKSEINNLELIYNQVRDLSHDLNSEPKFTSSFYEKLDISVHKMTEGFSSKSVNIFPKEQINNITDKNLQASILSTSKELITNIIKHAEADIISVDIAAHKDELIITVFDNGIGFNPIKKSEKLGFSQIKSRTLLYDGEFEIDSNKNNGTTITTTFKLMN